MNIKKLTKTEKLYIHERDNRICRYCLKYCTEDATIDHIVSRIEGGSNHPHNLATACRDCNFRKSLREGKLVLNKNCG